LDFCLLAVAWYLDPGFWLAIVAVIVALGLVIFVHEFGHFAVAKLCGVKVEKFYMGFDIAGLKLFHFRRGETEYGIGILPLGGYVKMLGQEDNPGKLREEIERAKAAGDEGSPAATSTAEAEQAIYDPRSYLAQSVPKRMAIISAGVVMNMIFAWVLAVAAFMIGVWQEPCVVGGLSAGGGAWQADVRVGDKITAVDGNKVRTFQEMKEAIVLGDPNVAKLKIERPGLKEPVELTVKKHRTGGAPGIGVASSFDPVVAKDGYPPQIPALPGTPAADAQPSFQAGDRIVSLDDQPVAGYTQLEAYLALHCDKPLRVTVARGAGKKPKANDPASEQVTTVVAPRPMRQLGLVMDMGEIKSIQASSPAEAAGIQAGDKLLSIDGKGVGDPMTLPQRLRARAGQTVTLSIDRRGEKKDLPVKLRLGGERVLPLANDAPVAVAELGLAYQVLNSVQTVEPDSPAAAAGILSGDTVSNPDFVPPSKADLVELRKKYDQPNIDQGRPYIKLDKDNHNWPQVMYVLQSLLPGTTVQLTWSHGDKKHTEKLVPAAARDWFNPERGWNLKPTKFFQVAESFGEAVRYGTRDTLNQTLVVYRSLHRVSTGDVSVYNMGGPFTILLVAADQARQGVGKLLLFLTLLGANLAVLNFLPIPVLDGGHIVFLLWEAIRGKPPNQRVQEVLTYIGLALILTLMIFVLGLDVTRIVDLFR
jgi:regulator of sigma E protease